MNPFKGLIFYYFWKVSELKILIQVFKPTERPFCSSIWAILIKNTVNIVVGDWLFSYNLYKKSPL